MAYLIDNVNKEKFVIPSGETVIGRGPYLRVKELSLSRSHAVVLLNDGKVCIKPIHKNPTYFYSSVSPDDGVQLEKDKWKELVDGDSISLLSDSCKYHIKIDCPVESIGNQMCLDDEKQSDNKSIEKANTSYLSNTLCDVESQNKNENTLADVSSCKKDEPAHRKAAFETPPQNSPKKRTLPTWMFESESPSKKKKNITKKPSTKVQSISSVVSPSKDIMSQQYITQTGSETNIHEHSTKQIAQIETSPKHETCYEIHVKDKRPVLKSSMDQESKGTVELPSGDENQGLQEPDIHTAVTSPDEPSLTTSPSMLISQDELVADTSAGTDKDNDVDQHKYSNNNSNTSEQEKDNEEEEEVESKKPSDLEQSRASVELKPCPYGRRCYRKNPLHFKEFSHGKDNDADDNEQNSIENKRECPYGMKCYRQNNPHHTVKYTHNSIGKERTARGTRKRRKKKGKSLLDNESDNDGENEYDLNDSFLDSSDNSGGYSDDSGDSDYVPPGYSDDDEDLNELVSEAKGFISNNKM